MNQVDEVIQWLFANDSKEMKKICNKEMMKFGGISEMDYDDFYSQVGWDISKAKKNYEKNFNLSQDKTFKEYIYGVIKLAVWKQMTKRNRGKRQIIIEKEVMDGNGNTTIVKEYVQNVSLDASIGDENDSTIGDFICASTNIEQETEEKCELDISEQVNEYLSELSHTEKEIAKLIMQDFSPDEIKEKLNLSDDEYKRAWKIMSSYEKKRILYQENNDVEEEEMNTVISMEDVAETYKNTSYSIDSISKQLRKKKIRDNHILQRHSGLWQRFAKSELISDILRGKSLTQIIISEEIKDGVRMQWLIDGKQRCTTLDDYLHNGFSISKNVKNYNIKYQTIKLDEDGNEVLNEDGFVVTEIKEFDIRGKKFKQLPEELQDIFKDRQIPVLYNMNCTKKDIADDIARFNRSRPMNKAQNGWLGLDEYFAEFAENIAKMQFFKQDFKGTNYSQANHTSGEIRRVVIEGIMVSDFLEDYDRDFNKMCEYLTEEASDSNFTEFYSFIERLTSVCDERVANLFNKTDSFIWFGLFSRFASLGVDDKEFINFLAEFDSNLREVKVNGISFAELCTNKETGKSKGTKDKSIVVSKLELLEALMLEYLHINKEDIQEVDCVEFVKENIEDTDDKDIEEYERAANSVSDVLDEDSWMLSDLNRPSYLAIVGYAYKKEEEDDGLRRWLPIYVNNNQFILNQQKMFLHMKNSFDKFLQKSA